jgi:hypothetical protein
MDKLTLDAEKLTVDSFETGPGNQDCAGVSAGATRTCPLDAPAGPARP